MSRYKAITINIGERFGQLVVISSAGRNKENRAQFLCKCDCGNETVVLGKHLKSGNTKSCGCLRNKTAVEVNTTHGLSKTPLYRIWASMKDRCYCEKCSHYKNYGGRGIKVCDEWRNNFQAFYDWATANGYEENLSIDRIDVNGNYEPANCRWITKNQQSENKTTTLYLTKDGETHRVKEWAEILGLNIETIYSRRKIGFSDEECLFVGRLPRRTARLKGAEI